MDKKVEVVVKKPFMDKYTGKTHETGEKLTITCKRHREIMRSGDYVEIVKETEKASKK